MDLVRVEEEEEEEEEEEVLKILLEIDVSHAWC